MKQGQAELIGLVIIIVLILIGALFYLRFSIFDQDKPARELSTLRVTQATNLMNSLLELELCQRPFKEAVLHCHRQPQDAYCGAKNACATLTDELRPVFDELFKNNIGVDYAFTVQTKEEDVLHFGSCETGTTSPPFRIQTDKTPYLSFLRLCALP
ncbi:MAG TPA: hypothetical protein VFE88_04210 [Candidatus Nanoarchaeia archaeon]|nr:hypothetical protein [Candidatus Nanoarchaeia archaeon]